MGSVLSPAKPDVHPRSFVAPGACLIGGVTLREGASVWYHSVLRADLEPILIGENSNIQDGSVVHVETGRPVVVGRGVTVGHRVVLHACTIEDGSLVGMGSVVLDGAVIPRQSLLGAGSLVPPGKSYPPGSLILGSPARFVRKLADTEIAALAESARRYREYWEAYQRDGIAAFLK
jgi:carbonic anhydrase/acetyltransferase-like protein (isoleucine patch superfamily)